MIKKKAVSNTGKKGVDSKRRMCENPVMNKWRRLQIFEAVAKAAVKRRVGNLSLDDIAASTGKSKGPIYYYFKSKGDLLYQMQMYAHDIVEEAVQTVLDDSSLPVKERISKLIYSHSKAVLDHWMIWRFINTDAMLYQADSRQQTTIHRRRRRYVEMVSALIQEMFKDEGVTSIEPDVSARLIFGIINSIPQWYKKNGKLTPEELSNYVANAVFSGFFSSDNSQNSRRHR
jgi:AcrR family transcriptional regulator